MKIYNIMIISLICTIIIETIVALILKVRNKKDILNIILVNIITNPLLVSITFTLNVVYGLRIRRIATILLEIIVVFIEGFIYQKYLNYKKINSYILSLILNLSSYTLGLLINYLIWS